MHVEIAAKLLVGLKHLREQPRRVDRAVWAGHVRDLHRVVKMVRSLFLLLEHQNEALLRVCMEVVTSKFARQLITWHDDEWYADEEKRESLRETVQEKLQLVLKALELSDDFELEGQIPPSGTATPSLRRPSDGGSSVSSSHGYAPLHRVPEARVERPPRMELHQPRAESQLRAETQQRCPVELQSRFVQTEEAGAPVERALAPPAAAPAPPPPVRAHKEVQTAALIVADPPPPQAAVARATRPRAPAVDEAEVERQCREASQRVAALEAKLKEIASAEAALKDRLQAALRSQKEAEGQLAKVQQDAEAREKALTGQLADQRLVMEEMQLRVKDLLFRADGEGVGPVMQKLFVKVGLDKVVSEHSVWDRLYTDAKDRITRLQQLRSQYGLGDDPELARIMEALQASDLAQRLAQKLVMVPLPPVLVEPPFASEKSPNSQWPSWRTPGRVKLLRAEPRAEQLQESRSLPVLHTTRPSAGLASLTLNKGLGPSRQAMDYYRR